MLHINLDGIYNFVKEEQLDYAGALQALQTLQAGTGKGSEYTGWLDLPKNYDKEEFARIKDCGKRLQEKAQALVVIGIGGSYLGARAALEMLRSPRFNESRKSGPAIYFLGNGISSDDIAEVLELIQGKELYVNVISKSGSTLEPALAFRVFMEYLEKTYGTDALKERIICTTDKARGALKGMADKNGWECFVIPDEVGGRYSILTPVGLLPLAAAGIDIDAIMAGAAKGCEEYQKADKSNAAIQYAAARQALYRSGKKMEILSYPGEKYRYFAEWWKQLYGESEGKDGMGLFPTSCQLTADLHSLGQYIQDGERTMIETFLRFERSLNSIAVPGAESDGDGLNFLSDKGFTFDNVFACAAEGIRQAHITGQVPCMELVAPVADEVTFGELIYFFEIACGISGYLQGVNPFDQPGVEEYKKNVFRLLRS